MAGVIREGRRAGGALWLCAGAGQARRDGHRRGDKPKIVRRIFREYAAGASARKICIG